MTEFRERLLFAFVVGLVAVGFGVNCTCSVSVNTERNKVLENHCMSMQWDLESIISDVQDPNQAPVARAMFDRLVAHSEYAMPRLCFSAPDYSIIRQCYTDGCVLTTSKYLLGRIELAHPLEAIYR